MSQNLLGKGKENVTVTLSWSMILTTGGIEILKEGKTIKKRTNISIKKNGNREDLWSLKKGKANEKLDIVVETRRIGKVIIIKITEFPSEIRGGNVYWSYGDTELGELTCE